MRHFQNLLSTPGRPQILLATLTLALALPTPARAAVVTTGDVVPTTDPATWSSSTTAYIGNTALGTLTVDDGSSVRSHYGLLGNDSGSEGTATVGGSGSTWEMNSSLTVGGEGTGTLNIQDGGLVKSSNGYLGYYPGSNGTATVSGSGSTWEISAYWFNVGGYGTGTLNVQDGGLVKGGNGYLGYESGSEGTVTVSGTGSTCETNRLYVGNRGTGTLNIQDGGLVKSRYDSYLGIESGSEGTATVSGSGSTWDIGGYYYNSRLYVGYSGTGTLNIQDGGLVSVGRETYVNGNDTGSKIVFDGGSLQTRTIWAATDDLQGVGTIKTAGWVLDADVIVNTPTLVYSFAITDPATSKNISFQIDQTGTDLGDVGAGYHGTGTLTINSGGLVKCDYGYLGYESGSEGTATVSGTGSTWDVNWYLFVGRYGTGTLNIQDGGLVKNRTGRLGWMSGSEGTVTVSGTGSTWETNNMSVGGNGTGTLNIQDGGLVKSSSQGSVGAYSGSEGTATVSGSGSTWEMIDQLYVGSSGTGTLNIQDGALVKSSKGYLSSGSRSEGTVTVSGTGSTWEMDYSLFVGYNGGTGTLNIQDGALVKNGTWGYIGAGSGSDGTATVSGTGSTWEISGGFNVGGLGMGTLNIQDGGLVKCGSWVSLRSGSGSDSTATVSGTGSIWAMSSGLSVHDTGRLNIQDGGLVSVGGDTKVRSGRGTLTFGIGSSGSGLLDVGGNVGLDGAFGVTLLDGYMPDVGDSFTLIQAGGPDGITGLSHGGMMAQLPAIDWWLFWESDYAEGSSELTLAVDSEYTPFPLDIRPGSDENPLNLKSKGVLPVSILTSDEFDALSVDLETLLFGDPLLVDRTTTPLLPIRFNEGDVNDDGLMDLTLFFSIRDLLDAGMLDSLSEEAFLFGALSDGTEIFSSDMLSIVPKPKGKFLGAIDEAEAFALGRSASISPIPEPGTLALLCMGAFGLLMYGCRSRRVRRDAP